MIVILLQDINEPLKNLNQQIEFIKSQNPDASIIKVLNKADLQKSFDTLKLNNDVISISAKTHTNLDKLKNKLVEIVISKGYQSHQPMVSNVRHYNELKQSLHFLEKSLNGLNNNITTDIIAEDLKFAIQHLSNITGNITSEDILKNIFSKFCIGK